MAPFPDLKEEERWQVMKIYKAAGMEWSEIIPQLVADGLLACKNHQRVRYGKGGVEICMTCEMNATQFWRRHLHRLTADEADVMEVRFEWIEAHRFIARECRKNYRREIEDIEERTELNAEGKPVMVRKIHRTVKIERGLLQLLSQVHDKMAKVAGMDLDDPESLTPTPQGKIVLNRAKRSTDSGDGKPVN